MRNPIAHRRSNIQVFSARNRRIEGIPRGIQRENPRDPSWLLHLAGDAKLLMERTSARRKACDDEIFHPWLSFEALHQAGLPRARRQLHLQVLRRRVSPLSPRPVFGSPQPVPSSTATLDRLRTVSMTIFALLLLFHYYFSVVPSYGLIKISLYIKHRQNASLQSKGLQFNNLTVRIKNIFDNNYIATRLESGGLEEIILN